MRTMRRVLIGLAAVSFVSCSSSGIGHHGRGLHTAWTMALSTSAASPNYS
jgi:hypothetical protein